MDKNRLSEYCVLSAHRKQVNLEEDQYIEKSLTQFGKKCFRTLYFDFNEKNND